MPFGIMKFVVALVFATGVEKIQEAPPPVPLPVEIVVEEEIPEPEIEPKSMAEMVADATGDPRMAIVAHCESQLKHFNDDGTVLLGWQNPKDIGVFQINEPTWGKQAKRLGYDIRTLEGNLAMGGYIFKTEGFKPWKYSKPCWGKYFKP